MPTKWGKFTSQNCGWPNLGPNQFTVTKADSNQGGKNPFSQDDKKQYSEIKVNKNGGNAKELGWEAPHGPKKISQSRGV